MRTNPMTKTKLSGLVIALGMMTVTTTSAVGQSRALPVYEVSRTTTPIKVDGMLNDAVWAKASTFRDFLMNLDGSPSPAKTEARALYDDKFLYFSFRCRDDNIWANFRRRDQHLWEEEVV